MNTFIFYLPPLVFNSFDDCKFDNIDFVVASSIQPVAEDKILIFCTGLEYDLQPLSFNVDEVGKTYRRPIGLTTVVRMSKAKSK